MSVRFVSHRLTLAFYASVLSCILATSVSKGDEVSVDSEERRIYGILIDTVSEKPPGSWVMVAADTASFECNPPAPIGLNIDGCSGMRGATETPVERMAIIRRDMSLVTKAMSTEFVAKCSTSTKINGSIQTSATYYLWSPTSKSSESPLPSSNPEIAVYFSRAAFDASRTTALVYLGKVHWTNSRRSLGQYVVLKKVKGEWHPMGYSAAWSFN
jgi:hypothetical protein